MKFYHRVKLPDGTYTPGTCVHGPDGGNWPKERFGLPEDLTGKTVLDIGAYDGFFSFEVEKRGALFVYAANHKDCPLDAFNYLHKVLNSKVVPLSFDVESPPNLVPFDVVLFYGVLYHLKSPLIAMENVFNLTQEDGICLLETSMSNTKSERPLLEYKPGCANDPTNYFYPNRAWIQTAAREVGFKSCNLIYTIADRATFKLKK